MNSLKVTKCGHIAFDWDCKSLKRLCSMIADGTHFSPKSTSGQFMYLTSKNIRPGKLDLSNISYISREEHLKIYRTCPVKLGDVLLTKDGANTGNAAINTIQEPFSLLSSVAILRTNEDLLWAPYLLQFLLSPRGQYQLKSDMEGQAITRLTLTKIYNYFIPVPSVHEQKRLSAVLEFWDKATDLVEHLIAAKQEHRKWLIHQLLTGKRRLQTFASCNDQLKYKHGNLPENWGYPRISKVAEEVTAKNSDGIGMPVLSCTKYQGLVDSLQYFGKQVFSQDLSTYRVVQRGQFAYATNHINEGSIGYQNLYDEALISPMYTVFQADNAQIDDTFLYLIVKTETYRRIFAAGTSASVNRRGSLRWKEFSRIRVPLPPIEEQKKIVKVIATADHEIDLLRAQLDALRVQKKGLMQQLLTGKVRVKIPVAETIMEKN